MKPVNVSITVEVMLPGGSGELTRVTKSFGHHSADGRLVTNRAQVPRCTEEAIEFVAQKVLAMIETEYVGMGE